MSAVPVPRVVLFADCFHEINGVALTARQLEAYAHRHRLPFLSLHAGPANSSIADGNLTAVELTRSPAKFALDADLHFDLAFLRHLGRAREALEHFRPDLIHITGPGDVGILGVLLARELGKPLIASWHTNIHEFGARRLEHMVWWLPQKWAASLVHTAEHRALDCAMRYYRLARRVLAPNPDLASLLARRTGRPVSTMRRGVNTELFSPAKRRRDDNVFTIGYVGRLTPEKNVRMLSRLEQGLIDSGVGNFRFLVVGQGSEREWLERNMQHAEFSGVLEGEGLARAYAGMDVFAFPSRTDTYGNVIQEAMASGVPCVVMNSGGPRFLTDHGENGWIASNESEFLRYIAALASNRWLRERMSQHARETAQSNSWDAVFGDLYQVYGACMVNAQAPERTTAASCASNRRLAARPPA